MGFLIFLYKTFNLAYYFADDSTTHRCWSAVNSPADTNV